MTRRFALSLFALFASLAIVAGACASAPAAPALTDPKEILASGVTSLKDVKTVEVTGSFTGSLTAPQLGNIDLSTIRMTGALDIPNKKAKFGLDAPTFLGTKIDALVLGQVAYLKIAGPYAAMLGASADKYTKKDLPASSANPAGDVTDVAKTVADLKAGLDKLPTPPTKAADEKCGDLDCYHVTLKVTAADMKTLGGTSALDGDVTLDIWTHKSDYRPAKITFGVTTAAMGTFGMTFDLKYDVPVSVDAPPADQVVSP